MSRATHPWPFKAQTLRPHGGPARQGDTDGAFRDLLHLVAHQGMEFPDASAKVCAHWGVQADALRSMYDTEEPQQ